MIPPDPPQPMMTAAATALPAEECDPYGVRASEVPMQLGMVQPIDIPSPNGLTKQQAIKLTALSRELFLKFMEVQNEYLKTKEDLKYNERTFIVLDAVAAIAAEWACNTESAHNSAMNIPSHLMSTVELFQHNFMQRQNLLYERFGKYVH